MSRNKVIEKAADHTGYFCIHLSLQQFAVRLNLAIGGLLALVWEQF